MGNTVCVEHGVTQSSNPVVLGNESSDYLCSACSSSSRSVLCRRLRACDSCSALHCQSCLKPCSSNPDKSHCRRCSIFNKSTPLGKEYLMAQSHEDLVWFYKFKLMKDQASILNDKAVVVNWILNYQNSQSSNSDVQALEASSSNCVAIAEITPVEEVDDPDFAFPPDKRITLDKLMSEKAIEHLSIRQIKDLLASNFVDYKGCCEKQELLDRAKRLWKSHHMNLHMFNNHTGHSNKNSEKLESEECKVCMDARVDCVFLECGHLVTCIQCGKQMNECPICRQYVVRAVRIFRA